MFLFYLASYSSRRERNNSMLGFRKILHVKIESFGYATVAFNCQTTDCRTVFSDGDILFDFQQSIYAKRVQELLSTIKPS